MSDHSFDPKVAKMVGVTSAVLFKHITFWIAKNKADRRNFYDGEYWTFTSIKALDELFCYLTPKQIRYAISKLVEADLLKKGNYNENQTDRTLWYSLGNVGVSICQKRKMDFTDMAEPSAENGKSLTYTDKSKDRSIREEHLLPDDWQPSEEDIRYCMENRPHLDVQETVDAFKFYWLSQPKSRAKKRNWSMAFKQWVLREKPQFTKPRKTSGDINAQRRASYSALRSTEEKEWTNTNEKVLPIC